MSWFGIASYGFAALAYGATAAILFGSHPGSTRGSFLAAATAVSSLWAGALALLLLNGRPPLFAFVGLDALHAFVWIVCILSWITPPSERRPLTVLSAVAGIWVLLASWWFSSTVGLERTVYGSVVAMALIGLLAVERVFSNAREGQRGSLGLLCLACAGIFGIDVMAYSLAMLREGLVPALWDARGLANGALVPLVLLATKRQTEWKDELFVSRQVLFYTVSLLGIAGYLLTIGVGAYVIRALGGERSLLLQLIFLAVALAVLAVMLFSSGIRARARVFLVKHFYRNKYDYRHEWLRLTQSLGRAGSSQEVATNALEGLALIIGSQRGDLWLAREPECYERIASLGGRPDSQCHYDKHHPLIEFLGANFWVIDSEEYEREPQRYGNSFGPPADGLLPENSIIVPLDRQGDLQGFVVLVKPAALRSLNFEDHDILKTAGRQVALVLAQALAQENLAASRQFEVMNKLSTFLMHDLKNIVAQQELIVANAQRFRHRPDFVDDAITTIRSSVERTKKVLEQLQGARHVELGGRVDVSKILMEVRSHCADRKPVPQIELAQPAAWVAMDRERLVSALTHLIRNAQDATPPDGSVHIRLASANGEMLVTVSDTGCGMEPAFVRDRLFRPFDSTKGAKGMGIGAYQVREMVRAAGGDVRVVSEPGSGTTVSVRIPCPSREP